MGGFALEELSAARDLGVQGPTTQVTAATDGL